MEEWSVPLFSNLEQDECGAIAIEVCLKNKISHILFVNFRICLQSNIGKTKIYRMSCLTHVFFLVKISQSAYWAEIYSTPNLSNQRPGFIITAKRNSGLKT